MPSPKTCILSLSLSTDVPGRPDADARVEAGAAQVARLGAPEGEGD